MVSELLTKYSADEFCLEEQIQPSQLKPYREILNMVYDNPEFKKIYDREPNSILLKILSYLETFRKKGYEYLYGKNNYIYAESLTRQFINKSLEPIEKLSKLPSDLQPSKESVDSLAVLCFEVFSQN